MLQEIGRYKLEEEIGQGGFATVYKATDTRLDRLVALKVMRPILMSDATFVARFQREAQVAAKLEHPNIIPIYDYGEIDGRLIIAMRLMDHTLRDSLHMAPLTWEVMLSIVNQVADALDFAHRHGVIHRDIKPENILLSKSGNVTLSDFGVVKAMFSTNLTRTLSGGILGTPGFMVPELWDDQDASPASDLYALACSTYEMLTGNSLFGASTPLAVMSKHYKGANLNADWPENVSERVKDILKVALARDPKNRYTTAKVFADALENVTNELSVDVYQATHHINKPIATPSIEPPPAENPDLADYLKIDSANENKEPISVPQDVKARDITDVVDNLLGFIFRPIQMLFGIKREQDELLTTQAEPTQTDSINLTEQSANLAQQSTESLQLHPPKKRSWLWRLGRGCLITFFILIGLLILIGLAASAPV